MTKEQIGKEIKELIRSIKTHYTFVEEEDRIPLIELELITSKIRKLYEKSIVNNYLHSTDEVYMAQERRRFNDRKNFEKISPSSAPVKEESVVPNPDQPILQTKTILPETHQEVKAHETFDAKAETPGKKEPVADNKPIPESNSNANNGRAYKDIKLLIGINEKFLLINNLFNRNDIDYKNAIDQLNTYHSIDESQDYLNQLAQRYEWNTESYACKRLYQILEKRYK